MKQSHYIPEHHSGEQPVRVLRSNIDLWFKETYPTFKEDVLENAIKKFGLNEDLRIINRLEKVEMPAGVGTYKIITVQETFLSYVWGLCYSLIFIYDKEIHQPKIDSTYIKTAQIQDEIRKAHNLFDYSISLLTNYNNWDKDNMPNPEYCAESEEYIFKANAVYLHAVNYILLHELAHIVLGHVDKLGDNPENAPTFTAEEILQEEYEADSYSINMLLKGGDHLTNNPTIAAGIISGICSFIFFAATMKGGDHPDPHHRLQKAFEALNLHPEDNLYGLACLAFRLWSIKFKIDLQWPTEVDTYKTLFNLTMDRLEFLKNETPKK